MISKKGKAIISIAMAVIMLVSVFAALAPMGGAVGTQNSDHNILRPFVVNPVLIGQKLDFTTVGLDKTIIGKTPDTIKGILYGQTSADYSTTAYLTQIGLYFVDVNGNYLYDAGVDAGLAVANPIMTLDLKVGTKSVSSVAQGTTFKLSFTNNLDANDSVDVVVINPDGNTIKVNPIDATQDFANITAVNASGMTIETTDGTNFWKIGTYTISIKTNSDRARGLSTVTNEKTLEVLKSTIAVEADKTSVAELGTVTVTVKGTNAHTFYLNSSDPAHTTWQFGVNDYTGSTGTTSAGLTQTIDEDGVRKYSVDFNDTGSYTLKVTDTTADPDVSDTIDISVSEKKISFDMPTTIVLGEKLTIKGTSNAGSTISIAIDDVVPTGYGSITIDADKEFSKAIETGGNAPANAGALQTTGSVRIDAFIDQNFAAGTDTSAKTDDGSTTILLVSGDLTAEISSTAVALGDEFTVSGTAKGSDNVEILTVAPKGASGKGLKSPSGSPYTGVTYDKTSVSDVDSSYSKKIDVREAADTGFYLVAVFAPGVDGYYDGDQAYTTLLLALDGGYGDVGTKSQDQLVAIIDDLTTTAGSDDLLFVATIKVETAEVNLDPITSVGVGEPLVVTGTSNRKEGFAIVVTAKGPVELAPKTVNAENGTFTATFDTTDAKAGTYAVKADDGDGHTDEATVTIGEAAPTAAPTAVPVLAPLGLIALVGVLSIVLALSIRRKRR